ncbi:hypothetical protein MNEG_15854, partial [Monoraphidium neglectum]
MRARPDLPRESGLPGAGPRQDAAMRVEPRDRLVRDGESFQGAPSSRPPLRVNQWRSRGRVHALPGGPGCAAAAAPCAIGGSGAAATGAHYRACLRLYRVPAAAAGGSCGQQHGHLCGGLPRLPHQPGQGRQSALHPVWRVPRRRGRHAGGREADHGGAGPQNWGRGQAAGAVPAVCIRPRGVRGGGRPQGVDVAAVPSAGNVLLLGVSEVLPAAAGDHPTWGPLRRLPFQQLLPGRRAGARGAGGCGRRRRRRPLVAADRRRRARLQRRHFPAALAGGCCGQRRQWRRQRRCASTRGPAPHQRRQPGCEQAARAGGKGTGGA